MLNKFKNKYKNRKGFIIGGGPSIKNIDIKLIDKEYISIGTNMSYKLFKTNYLLFSDKWFYNKFRDDLATLKDIKLITCLSEFKFNIPFPKHISQTFTSNSFYHPIDSKSGFKCNNTGSAAISFSDFLGLTEIYLFGFDLQLDEDLKKNYHDYYNSKTQNIDHIKDNLNNHFNNVLTLIKSLKHITFYSCSKISRLNDYIEFKEI
jgi:hypothetical protein